MYNPKLQTMSTVNTNIKNTVTSLPLQSVDVPKGIVIDCCSNIRLQAVPVLDSLESE